MRILLLAFTLLFSSEAFTQKLLKGVVMDAEKGSPVPKASVFLNNTSIGTMADNEGAFSLSVPAGKYELIVSSVGYITHNQQITDAIDAFLTINLKLKAPELEEIIIEPYEKDGWQKWGKWFTDNFVGTSEYGRNTKIKNPEVIKFRNSKKNNELTAIAIAPVILENKALGYRMTYQLEDFRYDFKNRYLFYAGYPFFENMDGSDRQKRGWEKAREDVYYGSTLHFMRALYRNRLSEEGFEVRRLKKIANAEKQRVKAIYQKSFRMDERGRIVAKSGSDSSDYYQQVLKQDDFVSIVGQDLLVGDSIAYAVDSTIAGLSFADYLLISYKDKKTPSEYRQPYPESSDFILSEVSLINGRPVEIFANGAYYSPQDLLSSGYWGWWEKMGTMLPFDYKPLIRK